MKKTALILLSVLCPLSLAAQSINQSVEVSNDFESVIPEAVKAGVDISVPDSLLTFDYDFDYSVFDSPYKGAYEFSPYTIQIRPESSRYDGRKLYLRAGAGFYLHPELDAVYAVKAEKNSAMSLYAHADGYAQKKDHDLLSTVGMENRWILKNSVATFGADYKGIYTEDDNGSINLHSAGIKAGIKSLSSGSYFYYDLNFVYRYANEGFVQTANQQEHLLRVSGTAGPVIQNKYRFLVDFLVRQSFASGLRESSSTFIRLLPHISFLVGSVNLNAGAKIDYAKDIMFTPSVEATLALGLTHTLYAGVKGGTNVMSGYDYKIANHRFNTYWMYDASADAFSGFGNIQKDKIDIYAGLNGGAGNFFQYKVKGGYALREAVPLERLSGNAMCYSFQNYGSFYGSLEATWKNERLSILAKADFLKAFLAEDAVCFAPAMLKGDFELTYNWDRRIWAGLSLEASSSRQAMGMPGVESVPSYLDLGVNAEYKLNSRTGVWMKAGNLLFQKIQRIPTIVEKGPYITLGISLSLQDF